MLFNEPKLLKCWEHVVVSRFFNSFSALQRAEIAEIHSMVAHHQRGLSCFSALQRAEIAEILFPPVHRYQTARFSALQRAEIAEICSRRNVARRQQ